MRHRTWEHLWKTSAVACLGLLWLTSPLGARRLDLAEAAATQFNCIFSTEPGDPIGCIVNIEEDFTSRFSVPGFTGEALL